MLMITIPQRPFGQGVKIFKFATFILKSYNTGLMMFYGGRGVRIWSEMKE